LANSNKYALLWLPYCFGLQELDELNESFEQLSARHERLHEQLGALESASSGFNAERDALLQESLQKSTQQQEKLKEAEVCGGIRLGRRRTCWSRLMEPQALPQTQTPGTPGARCCCPAPLPQLTYTCASATGAC
jgi:hypothetical protein